MNVSLVGERTNEEQEKTAHTLLNRCTKNSEKIDKNRGENKTNTAHK